MHKYREYGANYRVPVTVGCHFCGKEFQGYVSQLKRGRGKYCSKKCQYSSNKNKYIGENGLHWKGGRCVTGSGYIYIYSPKHPNKNNDGYVLEHRLVMENYLGRILTRKEVVHHNNNDVSDNRIENLTLYESHSKHMIDHRVAKYIALNTKSPRPEDRPE